MTSHATGISDSTKALLLWNRTDTHMLFPRHLELRRSPSLLLTDESLQCRLGVGVGGGVAAQNHCLPSHPGSHRLAPQGHKLPWEAAVRATQQARVCVAVTKRIVVWESNLEEKHPDLPRRSLPHHRQSSSSLRHFHQQN